MYRAALVTSDIVTCEPYDNPFTLTEELYQPPFYRGVFPVPSSLSSFSSFDVLGCCLIEEEKLRQRLVN